MDEEVAHKRLVSGGAEGGNRTHMVLPPPNFESGASTNFATSAQKLVSITKGLERSIFTI